MMDVQLDVQLEQQDASVGSGECMEPENVQPDHEDVQPEDVQSQHKCIGIQAVTDVCHVESQASISPEVSHSGKMNAYIYLCIVTIMNMIT